MSRTLERGDQSVPAAFALRNSIYFGSRIKFDVTQMRHIRLSCNAHIGVIVRRSYLARHLRRQRIDISQAILRSPEMSFRLGLRFSNSALSNTAVVPSENRTRISSWSNLSVVKICNSFVADIAFSVFRRIQGLKSCKKAMQPGDGSLKASRSLQCCVLGWQYRRTRCPSSVQKCSHPEHSSRMTPTSCGPPTSCHAAPLGAPERIE